jgi:hypothetical protein
MTPHNTIPEATRRSDIRHRFFPKLVTHIWEWNTTWSSASTNFGKYLRTVRGGRYDAWE